MSDFKVGDKIICVNDRYEDGQKIIHCKAGNTYEVVGEYFGTVKVKGSNLFFANWRFNRAEENQE